MVALYIALLAVCCPYAFTRGAAPERLAAAIILAGSMLSPLMVVSGAHHYVLFEPGILAIDSVDEVLLLALAAHANRLWTVHVAAIHVIEVLGGCAKIFAPSLDLWVYGIAEQAASYIILILIAGGTWTHRRRLKLTDADPSWLPSSRRSAAMHMELLGG